ncbi:hypothetical protein M501DRAFT_1001004 [Patellaria atrata CBS 101060]|uniref:Amino acid transporter transmembrane domain-containing protein n=1 Tax=Patellaria atrata CBS 101060 TaxID=1346257 RepID=A0A9P4SF59_9PEZI|nr:hypothetical protein M501DRAFT_1001004 [Patellaria atrata CBS 101060]
MTSPARQNSQSTIGDGDDQSGYLEPVDSRQSYNSQISTPTIRPSPHNGLTSDSDLRRRRSSMGLALTSIRQAGGVNSIDNFARSWQRAAGFHEITPIRPPFMIADDAETYDEEDGGRAQGPSAHHRSLLRAALEAEAAHHSDTVIEENDGENQPLLPSGVQQRLNQGKIARRESIFSIEPSLSSVFGGSYGTSYGSLATRVNESSMRHAGKLFIQQQVEGVTEPDKEREPLFVRQVEEDGKIINVVVGQSTLPQTIFNSVNVLIGVGLLSLPLALKYSGWVIGIPFLIFSAIVTQYTAKLLAKCLDVDSSLITFADLAYVSFGSRARLATSILFTLELLASCVALVILFADSLNALIPGWDVLGWKIVCGFVLIPLAFLPLRLLSFTSVLGILCSFGIVLAVIVDGLVKDEQPGSLLHPAKTYLFPEHWTTVPLSFGLLMAPWGGHSVFPNIYRDMRHPYKHHRGLRITYLFTFTLDTATAVVGLLMFGSHVRDEITSNIFMTPGFPAAISYFIAVCIAIIPLTKVPLNARPIISTVEIYFGLDARAVAGSSGMIGVNGFNRGLLIVLIRVVTVVIITFIAIVFPSFDRIMTLLGAVACFTVCIILPVSFHLKLFGNELGKAEKWGNWALIVVSSVMAVVSTVFACLPKELLGAR